MPGSAVILDIVVVDVERQMGLLVDSNALDLVSWSLCLVLQKES